MIVTRNDMGDYVCEHGRAVDLHCCNCHTGFLFDIASCRCFSTQMGIVRIDPGGHPRGPRVTDHLRDQAGPDDTPDPKG